MNRRSFIQSVFIGGIGLLVPARTVLANKSSVRIEAPQSASPGQEITITLHVSHDGNNFIHHTDWVYVAVNAKELKRWEFGMLDTPESENFSRTITYTVSEPITITAEADCNLHGSAGVSSHTIQVR